MSLYFEDLYCYILCLEHFSHFYLFFCVGGGGLYAFWAAAKNHPTLKNCTFFGTPCIFYSPLSCLFIWDYIIFKNGLVRCKIGHWTNVKSAKVFIVWLYIWLNMVTQYYLYVDQVSASLIKHFVSCWYLFYFHKLTFLILSIWYCHLEYAFSALSA